MLTIVIGDHHRLFQEAVAGWLARQPGVAAVHEAGTSDQIIDLVCREQPDLVLIDCELPGRDPFEAIGEIRRIKSDCRVLFLAERQYDTHVEAVVACGANGYLAKHEPLSVLSEAIARVMETGRYLSKPLTDRLMVKDGRVLLSKPRTGVFARLTEREWELLRHLACGGTLKEAATAMHTTYKAADNLKTNITRKLNIHDRVELARFAMREGVVCPTGPGERTIRKVNAPPLREAQQPIPQESRAREWMPAAIP